MLAAMLPTAAATPASPVAGSWSELAGWVACTFLCSWRALQPGVRSFGSTIRAASMIYPAISTLQLSISTVLRLSISVALLDHRPSLARSPAVPYSIIVTRCSIAVSHCSWNALSLVCSRV